MMVHCCNLTGCRWRPLKGRKRWVKQGETWGELITPQPKITEGRRESSNELRQEKLCDNHWNFECVVRFLIICRSGRQQYFHNIRMQRNNKIFYFPNFSLLCRVREMTIKPGKMAEILQYRYFFVRFIVKSTCLLFDKKTCHLNLCVSRGQRT